MTKQITYEIEIVEELNSDDVDIITSMVARFILEKMKLSNKNTTPQGVIQYSKTI